MFRVVGEAETVADPVTVRLTLITWVAPPVGVMVTVPWYVPGFRLPGATLTDKPGLL